jgi:hypothetical protein
MDNILDKARDIVYKGGEQNSERQYGTPKESFGRIASIASILCNKEITDVDVAKVQIAQKLVRESYAHKQDNLIDLCGYTAILNDLYSSGIPRHTKFEDNCECEECVIERRIFKEK